TGQTLPTSPLANRTWTGTAAISVTGGGGVTPSPIAAAATGPVRVISFNSPFGSNQFVPSVAQFSPYNYAPIPLSVAIRQYLPGEGCRQRINFFNHRGQKYGLPLANRLHDANQLVLSRGANNVIRLPSRVFTRGRFHPGKSYTWTHRPAKQGPFRGVVPIQ